MIPKNEKRIQHYKKSFLKMIKYSGNKRKISVFILKKLGNTIKTVFFSAVGDNSIKMAGFLAKSGAKKIKKIAVNFNEKL